MKSYTGACDEEALTPLEVIQEKDDSIETSSATLERQPTTCCNKGSPICSQKSRRIIAITALFVIAGIFLGVSVPKSGPVSPTPPSLSCLLSSVSLDGGAALRTPSTPQNKAYEWLANNTNLDSFDSYSNESKIQNERKIQRYSLATLYYSTNGNEWKNNTGWLSDSGERDWYNDEPCTFCSSGSIYELYLRRNKLAGTIPPELALLSSSEVRTVYFGGNALKGTIPTEIGLMTNLNYLMLHNNKLSGTIPSELAMLTNLYELSLYNNRFSGDFTCPDFIDTCYISCMVEEYRPQELNSPCRTL